MNLDTYITRIKGMFKDETISSIYFEVCLNQQGNVVEESLNKVAFTVYMKGKI